MQLNYLLEDFKIIREFQTKIRFPLTFPLNERSMWAIISFPVIGDFAEREEILDTFELEYEIEYKYSILKTRPFRGLPKRYENIMKLLDKKARIVIDALAKTFEVVFAEWLTAHALTNPHEWAVARTRALEDYMEYDMSIVLEEIFEEWSRYAREMGYAPQEHMFIRNLAENIDNMPDTYQFFEQIAEEEAQGRVSADLEDLRGGYMELNDWNETYGQNAKTVEEAEDLDDLAVEHISDVRGYIEDYVYSLDEFAVAIRDERIIVEMYRELVFPIWFQYWQPRGIVETRQRIEDAYKQLKSISRKPLENQFMTLNIVKNISHQTGSMMDYYIERYGVSEEDLKSLTEMDVTPWNKELRQIGVKM